MLESGPRPASRWMRTWAQAALDLLYPPICTGCGRAGEHWCGACDAKAVRILEPLCRQCGSPLKVQANYCPDCREVPPTFVSRSFALYRGAIVRALIHLKYRPNQRVGEAFAGRLRELYLRECWEADLVTAVPLGSARLRWRGYNQAALIARHLAPLLEIDLQLEAIERIQETRSQVGLDPEARRRNVAEVFRAAPQVVDGRRVLIVDDLVTTGSTLEACSQALLSSGASAVHALTVARAA